MTSARLPFMLLQTFELHVVHAYGVDLQDRHRPDNHGNHDLFSFDHMHCRVAIKATFIVLEVRRCRA